MGKKNLIKNLKCQKKCYLILTWCCTSSTLGISVSIIILSSVFFENKLEEMITKLSSINLISSKTSAKCFGHEPDEGIITPNSSAIFWIVSWISNITGLALLTIH